MTDYFCEQCANKVWIDRTDLVLVICSCCQTKMVDIEREAVE